MRISDWSSDVCSSDLTYCMKKFAHLLEERGVPWDRNDPLQSRVGKYVKALEAEREIREITRRIIKSADRKSVVEGKSVSVGVDLGGHRIIKKKNKTTNKSMNYYMIEERYIKII